jgi:hypothetical protein
MALVAAACSWLVTGKAASWCLGTCSHVEPYTVQQCEAHVIFGANMRFLSVPSGILRIDTILVSLAPL